MYYHLGHFSKFVSPGSRRVQVTSSQQSSLEFVGFVTPHTDTVLVVLNTNEKEIPLEIRDPNRGVIKEIVPALSIQTFIW